MGLNTQYFVITHSYIECFSGNHICPSYLCSLNIYNDLWTGHFILTVQLSWSCWFVKMLNYLNPCWIYITKIRKNIWELSPENVCNFQFLYWLSLIKIALMVYFFYISTFIFITHVETLHPLIIVSLKIWIFHMNYFVYNFFLLCAHITWGHWSNVTENYSTFFLIT